MREVCLVCASSKELPSSVVKDGVYVYSYMSYSSKLAAIIYPGESSIQPYSSNMHGKAEIC